jgi:hypothetical protein
LKPWAEFCTPAGHKTKTSDQGSWPTALSEQNHPKPYLRAIHTSHRLATLGDDDGTDAL